MSDLKADSHWQVFITAFPFSILRKNKSDPFSQHAEGGRTIGDLVGDATGDLVGGLTGYPVGGMTGDCVGGVIGDCVGGVIGDCVGVEVSSQLAQVTRHTSFAGNHSS